MKNFTSFKSQDQLKGNNYPHAVIEQEIRKEKLTVNKKQQKKVQESRDNTSPSGHAIYERN